MLKRSTLKKLFRDENWAEKVHIAAAFVAKELILSSADEIASF